MTKQHSELVVVGGGPGGYAAAFYAAERGMKVTLVEKDDRLGGVCLLRGCIPSKALLHVAALIHEVDESTDRGVTYGKPRIDLDKMRAWKNSIIDKLAQGVSSLADRRQVTVINGRGYFEDPSNLRVETAAGQQFLSFDKAIIAVGSRPSIPSQFDLGNPRIMTSDDALEIEEIPDDMLVVGGGYIGMELGTVYAALGSNVVVVEALDALLSGADPDLVRPVRKKAEQSFKEIRVGARVGKMSTSGPQISVDIETGGKTVSELYDRVLIAIGRIPNCEDIGLENTAAALDDRGFITVNRQQQTAEPSLFAIGDVTGGVLLAHKAAREARVAVDAILGEDSAFEDIIIPAVVFTDPEVAWCGLTEVDAKERGVDVEVAKFPWSASGRALSFDRTDGLTKLIIDPSTERILGVGIVGAGAGELIGEGVVAIEMGATARDLAESVHPHPTLSETIMESAEAFFGQATHLISRRKKKSEPVE
ncbi:MAG: dihydrolipoyl dehydrogenase [Ignavibacteria bacterium]|nr:dihydrolipoyl dehydrogenase [Ignavibacteria bacterium]